MIQARPDVRLPLPGPRSRELVARLAAVESPSFDARRASREHLSGAGQGPIVYARGEGVNVFDVDGNRYVDLVAGFGALLLGHAPDEVARAIESQMQRLWLALGDVFASDAKVALCERLARLHPEAGARVMLGSSGADAVTAALKTAALASGRPGIVAFEGAYHGLSHGPLAACGYSPGFREPFAAQLNAHVIFAPYPATAEQLGASIDAVDAALARDDFGAVLVEPLLGRGGCVVPPPGFLPALRASCDQRGAVLVCDEVWTGLGRSGAWLASAASRIVPDVLCVGKGLGAGYPISACIAAERIMEPWGRHGGAVIHTATHFGNPIACAAALATLEVLESSDLPARARAAGDRWMTHLRARTEGRGVREVRGRGMMIGIEIDGGAGRTLAVSRRLLERGWIALTGGVGGDVLTLTPPLALDDALMAAFADALAACLDGE